MSMLAPSLVFLAGLGLLPVLIHWLFRQRYRPISWAASRFLIAVLQRSRRRLRTREAILLALRMAVLAAAGLALARPAISGRWGAGAGVSAVIVLDASLSMQRAAGDATCFERGRARALEALRSLPSGSSAALLLASDVVDAIISEPTADLAAVAAEIAAARPTDGGTDLGAALERAALILQRAKAAGTEVFLFTDRQAGALPVQNAAATSRLRSTWGLLRPRPSLFVVDVAEAGGGNLAVSGVRCQDELILAGEPVTIEADVLRFGNDAPTEITVECTLAADGQEPRRLATRVVRDRAPRSTVRFPATLPGGWHRIEVTVAAADGLPADNRGRLAVQALDRLRVLVVDGTESEPTSVFDGEAGFLSAALAVSGRVEVTVASVAQLGEQSLDAWDAVVLADVPRLGAAFRERLWQAVRRRGLGLVVFAGDSADDEGLSSGESLPCRLGPPASLGEDGATLGLPAVEHPLLRPFMDEEYRRMLSEPRFLRCRRLLLAGAGDAAARVILSFGDGSPAVVEGRAGRGRVLVSAADATRRWSDFPLRPLFPILVQRIMQYVGRSDGCAIAAAVHDTLVVDVESGAGPVAAEIRLPDGRIRRVLATEGPGAPAIRFADTPNAGFYAVETQGRKRLFAVNPRPEESDLTPADAAVVAERLDFARPRLVASGEDLQAVTRAERTGNELSVLLLLVCLLCLVAEQTLAALWAPREA